MKYNLTDFQINLVIRYIILIFISFLFQNNYVINFLKYLIGKIIYFILLPIYYNSISFNHNIIQIFQFKFEIINACIANDAYIIIAILFFTINIKYLNSLKYFLQATLIFTIFNIIRILILIFTQIYLGNEYFEKIHLLFYEFLSGVVVFIIIYIIYKKNKLIGNKPIIDDVKKIIF